MVGMRHTKTDTLVQLCAGGFLADSLRINCIADCFPKPSTILGACSGMIGNDTPSLLLTPKVSLASTPVCYSYANTSLQVGHRVSIS